MSSLKPSTFLFGISIGVTLVAALASPVSAHFVWVETDAKASPGSEQSIKVYFGEYHEFLREEAGGKLDTIDGVTLRIVDPKRAVTDISVTKKGNHFEGTLPSCIPGRYAVIAEQHEAGVQDLTKHDLGIVKPVFHARTQFVCFEDGRVSERDGESAPPLDLDVIPLSKGLNLAKGTINYWPGGEIVAKVVFKGKPLASTQLFVHSPIGWDKELHTDSQGVVSFTPLWPGRYVLEVVHVEKTPGEFKGKPFEAFRHRATLSLQVITEKTVEK